MTVPTIPVAPSTVDPVNYRKTQAIVDRWALPVAFLAMVALGALGAVGSFLKVSAAAQAHHINPSWLLPIGVDGAIAVFTGLDLVLVREGKRVGWLRWFAWILIGVTVSLNVVGENDVFGYVAHAALPLLWATTVEAAKAAMVTKRTEAPDRIPLARWGYAPLATLALHRRMRLWQITSYAQALDQDRTRALAKCDLIENHGYAWRWKAPRRERELYRLGLLAPIKIDVINLENGSQGLGIDVEKMPGTPMAVTKVTPAPGPRRVHRPRRVPGGNAVEVAKERIVEAAAANGVEAHTLSRPRAKELGVTGKNSTIDAALRDLKEAAR